MIGIIQETGSAFHLKQSKHNVKFRFVDRRRRCARKATDPSLSESCEPFFVTESAGFLERLTSECALSF